MITLSRATTILLFLPFHSPCKMRVPSERIGGAYDVAVPAEWSCTPGAPEDGTDFPDAAVLSTHAPQGDTGVSLAVSATSAPVWRFALADYLLRVFCEPDGWRVAAATALGSRCVTAEAMRGSEAMVCRAWLRGGLIFVMAGVCPAAALPRWLPLFAAAFDAFDPVPIGAVRLPSWSLSQMH